jgi:hypothetical protein
MAFDFAAWMAREFPMHDTDTAGNVGGFGIRGGRVDGRGRLRVVFFDRRFHPVHFLHPAAFRGVAADFPAKAFTPFTSFTRPGLAAPSRVFLGPPFTRFTSFTPQLG